METTGDERQISSELEETLNNPSTNKIEISLKKEDKETVGEIDALLFSKGYRTTRKRKMDTYIVEIEDKDVFVEG